MMLYLHLPFCKEKCAYCAFCSGKYSLEIQTAYIHKLIGFLRHFAAGRVFRTVYIGGGTPSVLPLSLWQELLAAIAECVNVSALGEFTVELNPESTTPELLTLLKNSGVNRLSFGVQSLSDRQLCLIGRLHTARQAKEAILLAAQSGFQNISADLIYGLPEQTPDGFECDLRELLALPITHLSCYNLQLEEGTPLYRDRHRFSFPEEDEQLEMYHALLRLTAAAGMEHYEISNFAVRGCRAVHNSGYWTGEDYIGLGAAAHSKLGAKRHAFAEDVLHFIQKKDFSFDETIALTEEDIREETIMLGLRTAWGAPLSLLEQDKAQKYCSMGLGKISGDRFILNDRGLMVSNTVIADLI